MREIKVTWVPVKTRDDNCLAFNRVVYALVDNNGRIYYVGKADDQTLRERLDDPDKLGLIRVLRNAGGYPGEVLCGIVSSLGKYLLPSLVISSVEALLIKEENPWGNIVKPTITEDMSITCDGFWKGKQTTYEHRSRRLLRMPALARGFPEIPLTRVSPSLPEVPKRMGLLADLGGRNKAASDFSAYLKAVDDYKNVGLGLSIMRMANKKP